MPEINTYDDLILADKAATKTYFEDNSNCFYTRVETIQGSKVAIGGCTFDGEELADFRGILEGEVFGFSYRKIVPKLRRRGIGSLLYMQMVPLLLRHDVQLIVTQSRIFSTIGFLLKQGGEITGRDGRPLEKGQIITIDDAALIKNEDGSLRSTFDIRVDLQSSSSPLPSS